MGKVIELDKASVASILQNLSNIQSGNNPIEGILVTICTKNGWTKTSWSSQKNTDLLWLMKNCEIETGNHFRDPWENPEKYPEPPTDA